VSKDIRGRPFLTAAWRDLAMINFAVDPTVLRPLLPPGTELDRWQGVTLVSLVGFRFGDTRVLGLPVPGHRDFDEVNLRFYVRRRANVGGWRRGVVFVREFVPLRAVALIARWCYQEPYAAVPMRHRIDLAGADRGVPGRVAYEWSHGGRWHGLTLETRGMPALPVPGSEAEFIVEHYWGYAAQRGGGCKEYRVVHPAWRVWETAEARADCDALGLYGPRFTECLAAPPRSAFLAEGSAVEVHPGRRLPRSGGRPES
jgi:uncharacterized protein YqjF (DUF2071 family)